MNNINNINLAKVKRNINFSWLLLKISYSVSFFIAAADKFFNFFGNWHKFVNPTDLINFGLTGKIYLYSLGVIEIIIGLLLISKFERLGSYLASVWLVLNSLYMLRLGIYDNAGRYFVIAIGALVLANLSKIKKELD